MADPRAASNQTSVGDGVKSPTRRTWPDAVGVSILALLLLPAILSNALLWYEHWSGIGLYDPAAGGNPVWKLRPLLTPILVAAAGVLRLALSRVWLVAPRYRWILMALIVVALLVAAASQIYPPGFSYAPR
jgi:hypothetical protein